MKTEQVNVRIDKEWIQQLKQIARQESINQNKDINYVDLIRLAVKKKYGFQECIKED